MTTVTRPLAAPTPAQVKEARKAAGLTQREAGEIFGYSMSPSNPSMCRGWQQKETEGPNGRATSVGEWNYLLLLAGMHPEFELVPREAQPA